MFTFHERDNHKITSPSRMHLPIPPEVTSSQIFDLPDIRPTEVPPLLGSREPDFRLIRIY
jgi:hypothetical protein